MDSTNHSHMGLDHRWAPDVNRDLLPILVTHPNSTPKPIPNHINYTAHIQYQSLKCKLPSLILLSWNKYIFILFDLKWFRRPYWQDGTLLRGAPTIQYSSILASATCKNASATLETSCKKCVQCSFSYGDFETIECCVRVINITGIFG